MKKWVCLLAVPALVLGFQNCSEVKFKEKAAFPSLADSEGVAPQDTVTSHDPATRTLIQEYEAKVEFSSTSKSMDVIWVVDNSGSMDDESAWVSKNVEKFASYLRTANDSKMTIVSAASGDNAVILSGNDSMINHVDKKVGSENSLEILSDLLDGSYLSGDFFKSWRAGVPKALVFVTDDESRIDMQEFYSRIPPEHIGDIQVVHSIVGMGSGISPCQKVTGKTYIELSQSTNGQVYNICEEDWTPMFANIALSLENQFGEPSKTRFELVEKNVEEILSISINGDELDSSEYSELGGYISISKSAFLARADASGSYHIKVKYVYKEG